VTAPAGRTGRESMRPAGEACFRGRHGRGRRGERRPGPRKHGTHPHRLPKSIRALRRSARKRRVMVGDGRPARVFPRGGE